MNITKLPTDQLEELLAQAQDEGDSDLAEEIEEELDRRDYDASDPAVTGARQDAQDACAGIEWPAP